MNLNPFWQKRLEVLSFALQPIVNVHSGAAFGFEALLRNYREAGFSSIADVFDTAHADKSLYALDLALRRKALKTLLKTGLGNGIRLFYNLDNRVLDMPDYFPGNTAKIMEELNIPNSSLYFEVSERHEVVSYDRSSSILDLYKQQNFRIALDDFGSGYSGLQLLYHSEPDMVKIDRFFISGVDKDVKKRLFITNVVNMAHIMGLSVVIEGIETESEFYVCRKIGCDFVQGYLVQHPQLDISQCREFYPHVVDLVSQDKRYRESSQEMILRTLEERPAIDINLDMIKVLETFRHHKNVSFFPVLNELGEPLGIIREVDLKSYVYSPFGFSLLRNHSFESDVRAFLSKAPVAEIQNRLEKILELFSLYPDADALIITENGKYRGILDSRSLINILNEKKVARARDENPLSRLPGNNYINEYISSELANFESERMFVYFDFDNFKPFNDNYGFRLGDRIILLFADILREHSHSERIFAGHIGGDDFFVGFSGRDLGPKEVQATVRGLIERFSNDVLSFYSPEDVVQGFFVGTDRDGMVRNFPLLSVSAGIVHAARGMVLSSPDQLNELIVDVKKRSKAASSNIAYALVNGNETLDLEFEENQDSVVAG